MRWYAERDVTAKNHAIFRRQITLGEEVSRSRQLAN
jgi:hypothetical protein